MASATSAPHRISSPRLVGREEEFNLLRRTVLRPPAIVLIEGEAGVGKTRLVAEMFVGDLGRRRILGRCHPFRDPFPLGPLVDALRSAEIRRFTSPLAGSLRPFLPELGDRLPPSPVLSGDPILDRHVVFRALRDVLAQLGPTVCVLEDLHWGDEATLEFLYFLAAEMPGNLSLVLTHRTDGAAMAPLLSALGHADSGTELVRIHVAPLAPPAVRELVRAILDGTDISDEFTDCLHEKTSGIPFAVEEVLRLVQDRHDVLQRDGKSLRRTLDTLEVPPSIRDAVLERVGRLTPVARRLVQAAAVLAEPASEETLLAVSGVPASEVAAALSQAITCAVLFELEKSKYGLRHALAGQAVYEALPGPERRDLHQRAAETLERNHPQPVATLAFHWTEAGAKEKGVGFAETAADIAVRQLDPSTAVRLLEQALSVRSMPLVVRSRLAIKLARAALDAPGNLQQEIALLKEVVGLEGLPESSRGELRLYLGELLVAAGAGVAGRKEQLKSVGELETEPRLAVKAMTTLARPWALEGQMSEHQQWVERAEVAGEHDNRALDVRIGAARASLLLYAGEPSATEAIEQIPWDPRSLEEQRELFEGSIALASASLHLGQYERAQLFLSRADALCVELGYESFAASVDCVDVVLHWARGEWHGLETRAARLSESSTDVADVIVGTTTAGLLSLARGSLPVAEQWLRQSVQVSTEAGRVPPLAKSAAGLARVRLAGGGVEGAVDEVLPVLDVIAAKNNWVWAAEVAPAAVEAFIASGQLVDAKKLTRRFGEGVRHKDAPLADAALAFCRGMIAVAEHRLDAGVKALAYSEQRFRGPPRPYEAALVQERRGRHLVGMRQTGGVDALVGALAAFDALGATGDAARTRRYLRQQGISLPTMWRGGRRGYGSGLSPREEQVTELVAQARSNGEIAAALFLSAKTVEHHVAAAARKLGVRSRTALARAWLTREESRDVD